MDTAGIDLAAVAELRELARKIAASGKLPDGVLLPRWASLARGRAEARRPEEPDSSPPKPMQVGLRIARDYADAIPKPRARYVRDAVARAIRGELELGPDLGAGEYRMPVDLDLATVRAISATNEPPAVFVRRAVMAAVAADARPSTPPARIRERRRGQSQRAIRLPHAVVEMIRGTRSVYAAAAIERALVGEIELKPDPGRGRMRVHVTVDKAREKEIAATGIEWAAYARRAVVSALSADRAEIERVRSIPQVDASPRGTRTFIALTGREPAIPTR